MNADFELKVRMQNVLKALGYYTRVEVKMAQSDREGSRKELTDLDVLAVHVTPDLAMEYVVADCTTNRRTCATPTHRIFWLRGVMDFFVAQRGYLVLGSSKEPPPVPRAVATRLGIGVVNAAYLAKQEERVAGLLPRELRVLLPEAWDYLEQNLSNQKVELAPLVEYRRYDFWQKTTYQNLQDMLAVLGKAKEHLDAGQRFHRVLVLDLVALYSLALLDMAGNMMLRGSLVPTDDIRTYLLGGEDALRSKERLIGALRAVTSQLNAQQPTLFANDPISLDPPYMAAFLDAVVRVLNRPKESSTVPHFLQAVLFERVLNRDPGATYHEDAFSDVTKKLARDIGRFVVSASGIDRELLRDVL